MREEKIEIVYYSDGLQDSLVSSAFENLKNFNNNIVITKLDDLEIKQNEIIILQLSLLEERLFSYLKNINKEIRNNIIFILKENDALLLNKLLKIDFSNFFVFPQEQYKFIEFMKEIIESKKNNNKPNEKNYNFEDIIGNSQKIKDIIELSKKTAEKHNINILILGETGTGKGLLAKAIHNYSVYKDFPFIDVVCTAIPENLMESELFGYEKGAFTNASITKPGLFELAEKGTIFLDEIGDLNINIQAKLLRTIDKKVIRRVGGVYDIPIHARIISATNKKLDYLIEKELFRKDLYHRLDVVSIELPPLRHRRDDIITIANFYIEKFNKVFKKSISGIDYDFKEFLLNYPWPGNIRELQNIIERGVLLCDDIIKLNKLTSLKNKTAQFELKSNNIYKVPGLLKIKIDYKKTNLTELNKIYAREVLKKNKGNKSKTSKIMGISRPKLDSLLRE